MVIDDEAPLVAILDDDPSICRALERLLHTAGMASHAFFSVPAFFAYVENASAMPDCIVLDYQLGDQTGLDVQKRLNALGCHLPVVFLTASDDPDLARRAIAGGAIAFHPKPLDDGAFLASLNAAVRMAHPN